MTLIAELLDLHEAKSKSKVDLDDLRSMYHDLAEPDREFDSFDDVKQDVKWFLEGALDDPEDHDVDATRKRAIKAVLKSEDLLTQLAKLCQADLDENGLNEAKGTIVVAKLWIGYISEDDEEKDLNVTVFYDAKTPEAAQALADKMGKNDVEIDDADCYDALNHYAQNGAPSSVGYSNIHGPAYVTSVKIVSKEPKLAQRVFGFHPADLGFE